MKKNTFIINLVIFIFLLGNMTTHGWAQEKDAEEISLLDLYPPTIITRDPFQSQLPVKKEPDPEPPPPAAQLTPDRQQRPSIIPPQPQQQEQLPVLPEVVSPPPLQITGVVWNSTRPQAIINGQVVDEGDTINNTNMPEETIKILNITQHEIKIDYRGLTMSVEP